MWLARELGGEVGVVWPFGRSAKSGPSALLARSPLNLLIREMLSRGHKKAKQPLLSYRDSFPSPSGWVRFSK